MKDECAALLLSGVMLLEAVGLEVARTETLGALIGAFGVSLVGWLVRTTRKQG
jgi:hypothetical protein